MYNCTQEYNFCYKTSLPICTQIAWIHPNLFKTNGFNSDFGVTMLQGLWKTRGPWALLLAWETVSVIKHICAKLSVYNNIDLARKKSWIPFSQGGFVLSLVKIWQIVLKKIFKFCQCIFATSFLSLPWKMAYKPFIWTNLSPLYPRMFWGKFG